MLRTDHVPLPRSSRPRLPAALRTIDASLPPSRWDPKRDRGAGRAPARRHRDPADRGLTAQDVVTIASACVPSGTRVTVDAGAHMFPATMLWPVRNAERDADLEWLVDDGVRTAGGDWRGDARSRAAGRGVDRRRRSADVRGGAPHRRPRTAAHRHHRLQRRLAQPHRHQAAGEAISAGRGGARRPSRGPALARAFGVRAFCAETAGSYRIAHRGALACDGPSLIEARIDPSNYPQLLTAIRG